MTQPQPPDPARLAPAATALRDLETQLARAVVGQQRVIRELLAALVAGGHVLLEGLPGTGKTLLVRALAQALGGRYRRIQFTPDLMPADITGHVLFDARAERFHIRRGPIFCNFLLGDEINRAPAKTQSALLEAMQEQQVTIEGSAEVLAPPFLVFATQNPIEQEGTYPLPQAQLDRFLLKVFIDYPTAADEVAVVRQTTNGKIGDQLDLSRVEQVLGPEELLALQATAAALLIDDAVLDYAVRAARERRAGARGPRPRAARRPCVRDPGGCQGDGTPGAAPPAAPRRRPGNRRRRRRRGAGGTAGERPGATGLTQSR